MKLTRLLIFVAAVITQLVATATFVVWFVRSGFLLDAHTSGPREVLERAGWLGLAGLLLSTLWFSLWAASWCRGGVRTKGKSRTDEMASVLSVVLQSVTLLVLAALSCLPVALAYEDYRRDQEVISRCVQNLQARDPEIRGGAAATLGAMGGRAASALPDLREALQDEDTSVRRLAARAIARIDGHGVDAAIVQDPHD